MALAVLAGSGLIMWRVRGVLHWSRSLRGELNHLRLSAEKALPEDQRALTIIHHRCQTILGSSAVTLYDPRELQELVRSIAACYHPQSEKPELKISVGSILRCLEGSLTHMQRILTRPGFKRLQTVTIRQFLRARKIAHSPVFRWYAWYQARVKPIRWIRWLLFPDPLAMVVYLSYQYTLLSLMRCLTADVTLFIGRLAMEGFGDVSMDPHGSPASLEPTLEALESQPLEEACLDDPKIAAIREKVAGLTVFLNTPPTFSDWLKGIAHAAEIISARYFPDADTPWQEAALGPILNRSCAWVATLAKGDRSPLIRPLYRTRLETLYRAQALSAALLPDKMRSLLGKAIKTYSVLKWPLKIYRWTRRRSALPVAIETGWFLARRASLAHLYGKGFDKACQELENVYAQSKAFGVSGSSTAACQDKPDHQHPPQTPTQEETNNER